MRCQSRCVHLPANSTPTHSASWLADDVRIILPLSWSSKKMWILGFKNRSTGRVKGAVKSTSTHSASWLAAGVRIIPPASWFWRKSEHWLQKLSIRKGKRCCQQHSNPICQLTGGQCKTYLSCQLIFKKKVGIGFKNCPSWRVKGTVNSTPTHSASRLAADVRIREGIQIKKSLTFGHCPN